MKRREFITLLGGAVAAWPLPSHAQQPAKAYRVGTLSAGPAVADQSPNGTPLVRGFAQLGYTQNDNLVFERRGAEGRTIVSAPGRGAGGGQGRFDCYLRLSRGARRQAKNDHSRSGDFCRRPGRHRFRRDRNCGLRVFSCALSHAALRRCSGARPPQGNDRMQSWHDARPSRDCPLCGAWRLRDDTWRVHRRTDANSRHPDAYGSQHLLGRNHHQRRHATGGRHQHVLLGERPHGHRHARPQRFQRGDRLARRRRDRDQCRSCCRHPDGGGQQYVDDVQRRYPGRRHR